ncbi:MAG: hypothetical protein HXY50_13260 [Ignavibacteriaceae bacterium]|nr:hypothetical protein [Ignavibacteriaceae bacterium]
MNISSIGPKYFQNDEKSKVRQNKSEDPAAKDKIEISAEAKSFITSAGFKDFSEIRQKIESKYYDSKEVIEKIAEKILKQIRE